MPLPASVDLVELRCQADHRLVGLEGVVDDDLKVPTDAVEITDLVALTDLGDDRAALRIVAEALEEDRWP